MHELPLRRRIVKRTRDRRVDRSVDRARRTRAADRGRRTRRSAGPETTTTAVLSVCAGGVVLLGALGGLVGGTGSLAMLAALAAALAGLVVVPLTLVAALCWAVSTV